MLFETLQGEVARLPLADMPAALAHVSRAYCDQRITEAQYEQLAAAIEARSTRLEIPVPASPAARVGSRPRTGESMERRRRWAASGYMPPRIACRFTLAEQAALAVVAAEVRKRGACKLAHEAIAALAGVSRSTVKAALRQARFLGLVTVQERRISRHRNDTNVVRIVCGTWTSWLQLARQGEAPRGGVKTPAGTNTRSINSGRKARLNGRKAIEDDARRSTLSAVETGRASARAVS